jgi:cell division septal protein FtsQ
VTGEGTPEQGTRDRAHAQAVVVRLPRRSDGDPFELARLMPSGRSLLIAFGLLAGALLAWLVARETGLFGVHRIRVDGAPPVVAAQVRHALGDDVEESLLKVDIADAERTVELLPTVESATVDRAFPNELVVAVVPEHAVALVRQGKASAIVSARGRVMAAADRRARRELPRIWVPKEVDLTPGTIAVGDLAVAVRAVTPLAEGGFPGRVASVRTTPGALTLRLRSGLEIRLGDAADADVKLAVAARVLPLLDDETRYLDVSVPERPVSSHTLESQVEVEGSPSTGP